MRVNWKQSQNKTNKETNKQQFGFSNMKSIKMNVHLDLFICYSNKNQFKIRLKKKFH